MHIGKSSCVAVQSVIEGAWLYHTITKTRYTYKTTVAEFMPFWCDDPDLDDRMQELIRIRISQCELHTPTGLVLGWVRCIGTISACGSFHYFKGVYVGDDGRERVVQAFVKVVLVRYRLMSVVTRMDKIRDDEVDKNVVPTRFLVDGKIQVMEYLPGDISAVGLVDEPFAVVRFALWLSRILAVIVQLDGVYADLKPENILRKRSNDPGYCLCDVETIRSSNSHARHASSYPVCRNATDVAGESALKNMVYSYLVTVYSVWYTSLHGNVRASAVRRPLHYRELPRVNQHKTFDRLHPYFTKVAIHPDKPQMLKDMEERVVEFFADTKDLLWHGTQRETLRLFHDMTDYIAAVLVWSEEAEDAQHAHGAMVLA